MAFARPRVARVCARRFCAHRCTVLPTSACRMFSSPAASRMSHPRERSCATGAYWNRRNTWPIRRTSFSATGSRSACFAVQAAGCASLILWQCRKERASSTTPTLAIVCVGVFFVRSPGVFWLGKCDPSMVLWMQAALARGAGAVLGEEAVEGVVEVGQEDGAFALEGAV